MTVEKLKQAVGEIRNCRQDVIDRLVQFAAEHLTHSDTTTKAL